MESDGIETVVRCVSKEVLVIVGCHICGCNETGRPLGRGSTTTTAEMSEEFTRLREVASHRYKDPKVFPPVTSPVMKKLFFPSAAAHFRTPAAHVAVAPRVT